MFLGISIEGWTYGISVVAAYTVGYWKGRRNNE